jgi:hypothetical protein
MPARGKARGALSAEALGDAGQCIPKPGIVVPEDCSGSVTGPMPQHELMVRRRPAPLPLVALPNKYGFHIAPF